MSRLLSTELLSVTAMLAIGLGFAADASGQQPWFGRVDLQYLASRYSGSATARDGLGNAGFFVRADYLERGGFTVGYNRTVLDFIDDTDVSQDNYFLSGRIALTPDGIDGRITFRADVYGVSNDATDEADSATAGTAQISFLNFAETFYWDLGLSRSEYRGGPAATGTFTLDQLTPTLGFAFNRRSDWLQIRGYLVDGSASASASGSASGSGSGSGSGPGASPGASPAAAPDSTSALELKWTHWLAPNGFLGLDNVRFSMLGGERQYAVDHDSATLFNLAELQTGSLSAGGEWAFGERNRVLLLIGVEEYETRDTFERYRGPFLYLNFAHEWN